MNFSNFKKRIEAAGLQARQCTEWHWQVLGGAMKVNVYPTAKKGPTIYVNGTHRGRGVKKDITDAAIEAAWNPPKKTGNKKQKAKRKAMTHEKRRLWKKSKHCRWCGNPMTWQEATVDHVVPLARGGSNCRDNLVLACKTCNSIRGHDMPELLCKGN